MNMHSQGSAGFLSRSAVVALMDESREMNFSMPAYPGLVLVTETTLKAAISEIGQAIWKTCKQRHSFLRGSCSRTPEIVSIKSGKYQHSLTFQAKPPKAKESFQFVKSVYSIMTSTS